MPHLAQLTLWRALTSLAQPCRRGRILVIPFSRPRHHPIRPSINKQSIYHWLNPHPPLHILSGNRQPRRTSRGGGWGDLQILLRICNFTAEGDLPSIWNNIAPLSKYRARAATDSAFWLTSKTPRFQAPLIPYSILVVALTPAFCINDP